MKLHLLACVSVLLCLGGCEVVPLQTGGAVSESSGEDMPYYVNGNIDMETPVYVTAYPGFLFYHRYYGPCDCIVIVREGPGGYWYNHHGYRVHSGAWTFGRPTPRAVQSYRSFYRENRAHIHRTPHHIRNAPATGAGGPVPLAKPTTAQQPAVQQGQRMPPPQERQQQTQPRPVQQQNQQRAVQQGQQRQQAQSQQRGQSQQVQKQQTQQRQQSQQRPAQKQQKKSCPSDNKNC